MQFLLPTCQKWNIIFFLLRLFFITFKVTDWLTSSRRCLIIICSEMNDALNCCPPDTILGSLQFYQLHVIVVTFLPHSLIIIKSWTVCVLSKVDIFNLVWVNTFALGWSGNGSHDGVLRITSTWLCGHLSFCCIVLEHFTCKKGQRKETREKQNV